MQTPPRISRQNPTDRQKTFRKIESFGKFLCCATEFHTVWLIFMQFWRVKPINFENVVDEEEFFNED